MPIYDKIQGDKVTKITMNPILTLKIKNQIPQIFFTSSDGVVKDLTHEKENLHEEIMKISRKLSLATADSTFETILELASEGSHDLIDTDSEINTASLEFDISGIIKSSFDRAQKAIEDYSSIELSEELRNEIDRNNNIDILASVIDQIYNILIVKTLLAAYELEITDIHLNSDYNYPRLIEKMGNEIQKLGLEFTID